MKKETSKNRSAINKWQTFLVVLMISFSVKAQVGVNIQTPHPTAALQIESPIGTSRGLLTPSMSTANRIAIASTAVPADGLIVYDTDHKMHYYFQKIPGRWVSMAPLVLSTNSLSTFTSPSGAITTPSSSSTFSLGINKQNPSKELDVVGNAAVSGSATVAGSLNVGGSFSVFGFPTNPLVPTGVIVMYSGATVPSGWAICDGTLGTPDLRGRFIVAAGQNASAPVTGDSNPNYVNGSTGGENFHTLSKAETPKHTHVANGDGATISAAGGAHSHSVTVNGQSVNRFSGSNSTGDSQQVPVQTTTTSHSHPNNEFTGTVGNGTTDGLNGQAHENRPQYYALTFIMKL